MKTGRVLQTCVAVALCGAAATAAADDLAFGDPANTPSPPSWAVGFPSRSPNLDVLPGFQKPPQGYGIVPFYWWLGDPLTKERLAWQLEQMAGMGVAGYQINYAHSDKGGRSYGLTLPSEPPLFSDDWWELIGWFMQKAKEQGASISLSDYTLGFGQGWCVDEILREHPEVMGQRLRMDNAGKVTVETVPWSLNPLHPMSGKWYAEKFFGQFERRFPGEGGKGLNFFFSDELSFGVTGPLWSAQFAEEFKKRKGYDITPELQALFKDIGPRTPKIRLDYSDVMVALSEEGFFKPVFDWHQERGMIMGCDHGGRGRDVVEFGDYFRTQRWNQGPGADQPGLGKDLIKAKVASSIAHLYERPGVWLEGFYGSGWGTTSAGVVDATFANFMMGFNLLGLHGMYYSTHGGWWEWAPPDNTFRMPYWKHLLGFMDCVQRLSYVLSQGHHRCDVAIVYPVAPVEAGMDGPQAVQTAFSTGEALYAKGVDFDFMDFESLARAKVVGNELHVSGEIYRALVLPAMKAVRWSTIQKAAEFACSGGLVIAVGALPEASDRVGRDDSQLDALVEQTFGFKVGALPSSQETTAVKGQSSAHFVQSADHVAKLVAGAFPRDYDGPGFIQHRKIGSRDLYAIYNAPKGATCWFRGVGTVELWNPWTGATRPLAVATQTDQGTSLKLPLTEKEIQLIVFSPGQPIQEESEIASATSEIQLDGPWEFDLQPTSDNRFGDFHWPPTAGKIGPEIRQLWYCEGNNTNGSWRKVTCSFGPQFIQSSAVPPAEDAKPYEFSWRWGIENDPGHQGYHGLKAEMHDEFLAIGKAVTGAGYLPNTVNYESTGTQYFSTSVVAPRDMTAYARTGSIPPAKVWLNGELITGAVLHLKAGANPLVLQYDKPGRTYFVVSTEPGETVPAEQIATFRDSLWYKHPYGPPKLEPMTAVAEGQTSVSQPKFRPSDLAMSWWTNKAVLPFDVRPNETMPIGWYRFVSPPGFRGMTIKAHGKVQAWAGGEAMTDSGGGKFAATRPSAVPVTVLLRFEHERGRYAGAALDDFIQLDCGSGEIELGDWSKNEGLLSYSGGVWYRKTVSIPAARQVTLNLGDVVASAEVRVNGRVAGVKVAPPWTLDITPLVKPGANRIEVLVCNTLANHYTT
ncbi:MAG: glycosyl hydrolase, partial [Verrucomicrobiia bacterium]